INARCEKFNHQNNKNFMRSRILLAAILISALAPLTAGAQCSVTYQPYMYCGYGDVINSFTLDGTTSTGNGSSCGTGYQYYSSPTWMLAPGSTYNWSATVGGGVYSQGFAIWIDFNNNGNFESSEGFVTSGTSTAPSGTITVP